MDWSHLRTELYNEYLQENPSREEAAAFMKALVRMEDAAGSAAGGRLNDAVPAAVALGHLQRQYDETLEKVERLEKDVEEKKSRIHQFLNMNKASRNCARKDDMFQVLQEEVRRLKAVNDELIQKLASNS